MHLAAIKLVVTASEFWGLTFVSLIKIADTVA